MMLCSNLRYVCYVPPQTQINRANAGVLPHRVKSLYTIVAGRSTWKFLYEVPGRRTYTCTRYTYLYLYQVQVPNHGEHGTCIPSTRYQVYTTVERGEADGVEKIPRGINRISTCRQNRSASNTLGVYLSTHHPDFGAVWKSIWTPSAHQILHTFFGFTHLEHRKNLEHCLLETALKGTCLFSLPRSN
jgi:hypothetical protein